MGANNSTRRVSFESDENENVSVVKGIRLSENVINRMREPEAPPKAQPKAPPKVLPAPSSPPSMTPTITPSPFIRPVPPIFDHITPLPPLPSLVAPVAPPPTPSTTETVAAPPPPPPPAKTPTEQPPVEPASPVPEPVVVPEVNSIPPPAAAAAAAPPVDEVALRKTITDELHKDMEQDRAKAEQELQAWVETEKARAAAHAQDDAQSQVQGRCPGSCVWSGRRARGASSRLSLERGSPLRTRGSALSSLLSTQPSSTGWRPTSPPPREWCTLTVPVSGLDR
ncbi:hypothetical protein KUCAC02_006339, partial [Chaenocephalus aceratus]